MKNLYAPRGPKTFLAVSMLLVIAILTPLSLAAATTFTYIGNPFNDSISPEQWPASPAVGPNLTASFTYIGDLSSVLTTDLVGTANLTSFSMTCGGLTLTLNSDFYVAHLFIDQLTATGLPANWDISVQRTLDPTDPAFTLISKNPPPPPSGTTPRPAYDEAMYQLDASAFSLFTIYYAPGVWSSSCSAVPLPPAALLLGSGLLGLAGWRRFRKG